MLRWFFRIVELGIVLGILSLVLLAASFVVYRYPGPLTETKTIVIASGQGVRNIGNQLAQEGIVRSSTAFTIAATVTGQRSLLKAGEYEFTPGERLAEVLAQIAVGQVVIHKLTVVEGTTVARALEQLRAEPVLTGDVPRAFAEGSLYPDTYFFNRGDTRLSVLKKMQDAQSKLVSEIWANRSDKLPPHIKNENDLVTLASIVEKETAIASERERIAGVFVNRLKRNMKLQSDPTTIYAITNGLKDLGRPLTLNDLQIASPYNTYVADGLPPGPICIPGRAALRAAAHPEDNDYFYFVANGHGGHVFARDLGEHNRNVQDWRRIQSEERTSSPSE